MVGEVETGAVRNWADWKVRTRVRWLILRSEREWCLPGGSVICPLGVAASRNRGKREGESCWKVIP
jgi:hypothetical protein